MIIYLAGKITGDSAYKLKFKMYEKKYIAMGYTVLNPALLPQYKCLDWQDYMEMSLIMLQKAEAIVLLPDWEDSKGAIREHLYAVKNGLEVIYE